MKPAVAEANERVVMADVHKAFPGVQALRGAHLWRWRRARCTCCWGKTAPASPP